MKILSNMENVDVLIKEDDDSLEIEVTHNWVCRDCKRTEKVYVRCFDTCSIVDYDCWKRNSAGDFIFEACRTGWVVPWASQKELVDAINWVVHKQLVKEG